MKVIHEHETTALKLRVALHEQKLADGIFDYVLTFERGMVAPTEGDVEPQTVRCRDGKDDALGRYDVARRVVTLAEEAFHAFLKGVSK